MALMMALEQSGIVLTLGNRTLNEIDPATALMGLVI